MSSRAFVVQAELEARQASERAKMDSLQRLADEQAAARAAERAAAERERIEKEILRTSL